MKIVEQIKIRNGMKVSELVSSMSKSGVMGAGRIAKAADIFVKMVHDKDCTVFLGLAGAMVPGGMKNIIIDMLENKYVDVLVTTGANLTHDLVEALGYSHYQGAPNVDDKKLFDKHIDRIYDSFMPNKVYEKLEDFFEKHFDTLSKKANIKEFLWELGRLAPKNSILHTCFEKKIPVFCPAIADSGIGLMIWGRIAMGKKQNINAFDDMKEILDIAWTCKKAGVIYIGGGVPKNYIQQAMQFSPKSASYGIQITMDRPEPGGSSGAELREGISWGKMNKKGEFVDVICDATIALPIIYAACLDLL
jgi:deoxyhypusine synthase